MADGEASERGDGGHDAMDDDVVNVSAASTQEDGESSVESGSECGEELEDGESSCDEKGSRTPGGYDGVDPPMPVTGFSSRDHFREQCDNQLGCYSTSDSEPASEPDLSPSYSPSPMPSRAAPEPVEPMTREEKIRSFWKKYTVERSKHMQVNPPSPVPLPSSSAVAPSHGCLVPVGSVPGLTSHCNSDSDHLDSDTMRLSDAHRVSLMKKRAHDDDSDSDDLDASASSSDISVKSAVNQATFDQAMNADSGPNPSCEKRLSSASSKSTLETPHCSRPEPCLCLPGGGFCV